MNSNKKQLTEPYGMIYNKNKKSSRTAYLIKKDEKQVVRLYWGIMKINNSTEFGKFIKKRRKKLNYTQVYLSEVSGLSVSFISDVEKGKPTVELEKVIKLSNLLGVDFFLEERK